MSSALDVHDSEYFIKILFDFHYLSIYSGFSAQNIQWHEKPLLISDV